MNFVPCLEHVLNLRELHQEESLNSPWILCLRRWGNPDTLHVSVNLNNLIYHGVLLVPACSIVGVFVAQLKRPVKEKSSTIHGQIKSMKDCWALRRRAFDAADWHFCICHVIHRLHTSLNTLCTSPTIIFPFLSFSFTVLIYHISFFFQSCEYPLDSSWVLYWLLSVLCLSLCSCSAAVSKITPAGPTPPGTPPTTTQCLTPAVKTTPPPSAPADWISRTCSTQRYPTHKDAYCFLNETKIKSAESNRLPPPMGEKKNLQADIFFLMCARWTCVRVFSGLWAQAGSPPAGCAELRHAGHSGIRHHQGKTMITYSFSVCCAEGCSLKQKMTCHTQQAHICF